MKTGLPVFMLTADEQVLAKTYIMKIASPF